MKRALIAASAAAVLMLAGLMAAGEYPSYPAHRTLGPAPVFGLLCTATFQDG